jgi:hypothetical protein
MSKVHFEIVDGYILEDPTCVELPSEQKAKSFADDMARQIALDVHDGALTDVVVKTNGGDVVHRMPIQRNPNTDS